MDYRNEFKKLIYNIKVNRNTPSDEFKRRMQPLIQYIQMNVPESLYKFRECTENNLAAFSRDEIWLSKASNFNDVHDGLLFFDKHTILNQAQQIFAPENVPTAFQVIKQSPSILNQFKFLNMDIQKIIGDRIETLDERTFSNLSQMILTNLEMFLDSYFGQLKNEIRAQVKMACLSADIKSPLMWAHYAGNHKGFALGYDFRGNNVSQCANCQNRSCERIKQAVIYPIIYSDERFNATEYGKWFIEQNIKMYLGMQAETVFDDEFLFTKAALHKSSDWRYEDEWRIVCSTPDLNMEQKDCYPIIKRPNVIYFGSEISDINRKILTQIADEKGIAKYQMYVENYSIKYELNYSSC